MSSLCDVGIGIGGCGVYMDVEDSDFKLPVPWFPVPMNGSFTGAPVVTGSVVVLRTVTVDEVESNGGRCNELNNDSQKEVVSLDDCRSSRFDVLLEDEEDDDDEDDDEDDEDVEVAGAVEFVTIWRLTCRGK